MLAQACLTFDPEHGSIDSVAAALAAPPRADAVNERLRDTAAAVVRTTFAAVDRSKDNH